MIKYIINSFASEWKKIKKDISKSSMLTTYALLVILVFCALIMLAVFFFPLNLNMQYSSLAISFLKGRLDLDASAIEITGIEDVVHWNNRYFWPAGPIPAILLMPLIPFLSLLAQPLLKIGLNLVIAVLLYRLTKKIKGIKRTDKLWLTLGYITSTAYTVVAALPYSMYLAYIVVTFFFLLALLEYTGRKRWLLIGIFTGCMALTRANLFLAFIFFGILIFRDKDNKTHRGANLIRLLCPAIIAILLFFSYNYLRFGNIFETGYHYQSIWNGFYYFRDNLGLFNIRYLPANLYYLFLKGPEVVFSNALEIHAQFPYLKASPWGMSIFFTSPMFLLLLKKDTLKKYMTFVLGIFLILLPSLFYYGIGRIQYGYRYSLDVYPLIYFVLISTISKKDSKLLKYLIILGVIFNFWLGFPLFISKT